MGVLVSGIRYISEIARSRWRDHRILPIFTAVIIDPGREGFVSSSSDHQSISVCPNCGDARPGAYCARCGQNDRDYMRSPWLVAGDYFRNTFEVDSRVFRTLKLLFFRPGQLSIEFSRNRRARYLSPVRLFLFVSFVHFGALALLTTQGPASGTPESSPSGWMTFSDAGRMT